MADFSTPAPVEPIKSDVVHDRTTRPDAPSDGPDLERWYLLIMLGLLFTAAFIALAFQARASWPEIRDWVVPAVIPFCSIAGMCLAHLLVRRAWMAASVGLTLLFFVVALTGFDLWRAALTTGPDGLRDSFSITIAVLMGVMAASLLGGTLWTEWKNPARPPTPDEV